MESRSDRHRDPFYQQFQQAQNERVYVKQVARELGISQDTARMRMKRGDYGQVGHDKGRGRVEYFVTRAGLDAHKAKCWHDEKAPPDLVKDAVATLKMYRPDLLA